MARSSGAGDLLRAKIEHDVGYASRELGKYADALKHFRECAALYERMGDNFNVAECHYYIGEVLTALADTARALDSKRRYVELAEIGGDTRQRVEALRALATTLDRFGERDSALLHLDHALAIATAVFDSLEMALCLQDVADVHRRSGDKEEALELLLRSASHLPPTGNSPFIIQVRNDIASLLAEHGKVHEAAVVQTVALENAKAFGYRPAIARAHFGLAELTLQCGRPDEALTHALEGLREASASGLIGLRVRGLDLVTDMFRSSGQYQLALTYNDSLLTSKDSLNKIKGEADAARQLAQADYEIIRNSDRLLAMEEQVRSDTEHRMQRINLVVMIGFIILFAGVLFLRARTHRRMQLEQLRTRLSRDLHDDIGSTLSSINILSTVARRKAEAGDEAGAAASLSGISERTQRLMRNMSDIVWSVDPEKDTMEELLVRMREFGAAVLEPKGISYRFQSVGDLNSALPPLMKSNIYLIFKEAVNNAAKHAEATEVDVSFTHENDQLRMSIADNGKGMGMGKSDVAATTIGGNGLRNMRARAVEMKAELRIGSKPQAGTKIELVVPL